MNAFNEFSKKLAIRMKGELPGFPVQKLMAPLGRKQASDYLKDRIIPQQSAVLILLYPQITPYSINTILILRAKNSRDNHAGQISFPRGKFEVSDKNIEDTALRETEEEIGVQRESITIIGKLSSVYIPISNFMVQPFVGIVHHTPTCQIQPAEVDKFTGDKNK